MKNLLVLVLVMIFNFSVFAQQSVDEKAIRKIVDDMANAWTNGDGEGFAQHFSDSHDYFVWNGIYMAEMDKKGNAFSHNQIFSQQYKDTHHYAVIEKIKFLGENAAVLRVMSAVVKQGQPKPEFPHVMWMAVLSKNQGKWEIVSFHNADIEILNNDVTRANLPLPPEVMYKNWKTENN